MNALRLVCQLLGALLLLGWAMVGLALLMLSVTVRVERGRKRRELSVCRSCQEPIQGGYCANCAPIYAEDLRSLTDGEIGLHLNALQNEWPRQITPSLASPDTLERLLGPTVEEP